MCKSMNKRDRPFASGSTNRSRPKKKFDYEAFNDRRAMSPIQERWNAITMLPALMYGVYFVLAGCWLSPEHVEIARQSNDLTPNSNFWIDWANKMFGGSQDTIMNETSGCINIPWLPHFHALPPWPVLAGAIGIVVHAPFSIMYHWVYATNLHPRARIGHWSRRLDHSFIHFASACMAYATSGSVDYALINVAYNLDCAYKQFEEKVRPRRNQTRTSISILLYISPVLLRRDYVDFAQLVLIFSISGWFFITYPIGGWSHSMFHLAIAFLPYIIMNSATKLEASQEQIEFAAQCAAEKVM